MRVYVLFLTLMVCTTGCTTTSVPETAEMPQIPSSGWMADEGEHRSWSQDTSEGHWQIADYNSDGNLDYVRYQVPRGSYNHRVWVDRDYDGFFEDYTDADPKGAGGPIKIHMPVPAFEPVNQRPQSTGDARE